MSMLQRLKRKIKRHFPVIQPERIPVKEGELLAGKVALITGGGSGIGFGIAKAFRNEGASVVITGRTEETLAEAARKLGADSCAYVVWDASGVERMEERFEECVSKFGRIDILVNNAGYHGNQNFFTVSETDYDRTFDTNVKYVFFLSQRAAKYMIAHEISGHILNISSASSMKPAWSPYEISKWACRGFTRGLARELSPYHIVVNGIAPGPSATKMSHWTEGDPLNWGSSCGGGGGTPVRKAGYAGGNRQFGRVPRQRPWKEYPRRNRLLRRRKRSAYSQQIKPRLPAPERRDSLNLPDSSAHDCRDKEGR